MSLVQQVEPLVRIESRLDAIQATMITKADLIACGNRLVRWFVATAAVMSTIVSIIAFAAGRFIH